jgi:hypothetical protein
VLKSKICEQVRIWALLRENCPFLFYGLPHSLAKTAQIPGLFAKALTQSPKKRLGFRPGCQNSQKNEIRWERKTPKSCSQKLLKVGLEPPLFGGGGDARVLTSVTCVFGWSAEGVGHGARTYCFSCTTLHKKRVWILKRILQPLRGVCECRFLCQSLLLLSLAAFIAFQQSRGGGRTRLSDP